MNSISDQQIILDVPPQQHQYKNEIKNIYTPILRKHSHQFIALGLISWILMTGSIFLVFYYTHKIEQLLCIADMKLLYSSYVFIALSFLIFFMWLLIRQNILTKYFFKAECIESASSFYADEHFVKFTSMNGGIKNEFSWQYIHDVYLNKAHDIVLNLASVNVTLLPYETFEDNEQRQKVFNQLKTWLNQAKPPLPNDLG